MPTVPIYDTPQVDQATLPAAQFAAPDMPDVAGKQMAQLGQATLAAGATTSRIAQHLQAEQDDAQTKALDNEFADRMRVILHNKDTGYMNQVGKNAVDGRDATVKAIDEARVEISAGLQNDVQRRMFDAVTGRRVQTALTHVDTHAANQTRIWHDGESVARIKSGIADALTSSAAWNQKDADGKATGPYNMAKATAIAEARSLASMRGYDTAQTEQLVAETAAGLHTAVLTNMVSLGQSKTARDYLEAAAPEIAKGAPDKLDDLRNLVKQAGVKDESLTLSMQLKGGLNEQLGALKGLYDKGDITADVYDATRQRAEHNWQLRKSQQAEGEKALVGNAYDWLLKNQGKSVLDMPPGLYNGLKQTGHLANVVSFARVNGKPETDPTAYYGLYRMAMDNPNAFVDLDLLKTRHLLSPGDWGEMVKMQKSINTGEAKAMQSLRVTKFTLDSIQAEVRAIGIELSPKEGTPAAKKTAQFMGALTRSLDEATKNKGAPLTADEAKRIGMSMLREGVEQGSGIPYAGWLGLGPTKKRGFEIVTDPSIKPGTSFVAAQFGDIPAGVRDALVGEIKQRTGRQFVRGQIPSDIQQEIERAYTVGVQQGRF